VATLLFAMFKGVNNSLKINGPGFMLMSCINFVFKLEQDQRSLWIQVLKILLGKLMQHADERRTKELFEVFEVFKKINSLNYSVIIFIFIFILEPSARPEA
jgi:hypothetical protein